MKSLISFFRRVCLLPLTPVLLGAEAPSPIDAFTRGAEISDPIVLMASDDAQSADDYLFPRKHRAIVTTLTGFPYVAITEYAYGFTDRFSVGAWAGFALPNIPGFGVRPRYIVAQPGEDFRVHLKAQIIYYPKSAGLDPWFLAWPTVNAEWRRASGTRLWAGAGMIATNGGLTAIATAAGASPAPVHRYGSGYASTKSTRAAHSTPAIDRSQGGTWNTVHLGYSRPLTSRMGFQLELAGVLKGIKLSPAHTWVGGPPVILTTGVSYSF